ncbi:unnamed protein product [Onchocerca ochengi]|uniref:Uncharacterized protein n=1 Tax=Onchocerca ochengi TaxID=42157 RepID=A0A182ELD2_ONCOC|nr:unnamed protein product [Onchocerca ochengi]
MALYHLELLAFVFTFAVLYSGLSFFFLELDGYYKREDTLLPEDLRSRTRLQYENPAMLTRPLINDRDVVLCISVLTFSKFTAVIALVIIAFIVYASYSRKSNLSSTLREMLQK